jgi:hypothetical protein
VRDDGEGISPEKIQQLLSDRQTLDGEIHSLGFVFVRQTVAEFGGELAIESTIGKGTTMTLRLPYLKDKILQPDPSYRSKYRLPEKYSSVPLERDTPRALPVDATTNNAATAAPSPPQEVPASGGNDEERACGRLLFAAYQKSKAQFPGCIFAMAVTEDDRVEMFTHKPYARDFNISHEDLSPMYYQATYRGRIEEDELKRPIVILKPPQNAADYFDFKEVAEADRDPEHFTRMVRDEGIRIARKLIATGLDPQIAVLLSGASRIFASVAQMHGTTPFPLELMARQRLSAEES